MPLSLWLRLGRDLPSHVQAVPTHPAHRRLPCTPGGSLTLQVRESRLGGVLRLLKTCSKSGWSATCTPPEATKLCRLYCSFCPSSNSPARILGSWLPMCLLRECTAPWEGDSLIASRCRGADTMVGISKVTVYLNQPHLVHASQGTLSQLPTFTKLPCCHP